MKVALIGDVHANLPALDAVLAHAARRKYDALWNVGDLVGYGAFPNQVIERLRSANGVSIVGNYDRRVLELREKRREWRKKRRLEKFLAFQWADDALTASNRQYLSSLPSERELDVLGQSILLTHGSPISAEEHLTPHTPPERFRQLASTAQADLVICGHSHQAFVRQVDGVTFINTGSVGRPDDGDPRACYALLRFSGSPDQEPVVEHYRVAYDVSRAVAAIRNHRLPEAFAQMMIQGVALDTVLETPQAWDSPDPRPFSSDEAQRQRQLEAVLKLAKTYDREVQDARHVTYLALRLFDELALIHRLGAEDRFWLRCAGILHDIGWAAGQKAHHKTSSRLILEGLNPSFDERERLIVAAIARYHRGALPKDKHYHFAALSPVDQYRVTLLAACLRLADGLDHTHPAMAQDIRCHVEAQRIVIICVVRTCRLPERQAALKKADLLEHAFGRELLLKWQPVE